MANLTDTGVNGDLRVTGTIFGTHAGNFAVCSTAGDVAAKTVTLSGFTLANRARVTVKFSNENTATGNTLTLNVSGTGDKEMRYHNGSIPAGLLKAGGLYEFMFNSNVWELVGNDDAAAEDHRHGNITNDGKIGNTSGYAVYTTTGGALTAGTLKTSDPSPSGTSLTFIDTISQDANGKINPTKKTVNISATTTSVTVGSTTASIPQASSATPQMDSGSGSAGSGTTWAKGDHVHPTDTSREAAANKKTTLNASSATDFPTSQAVATYVGTTIEPKLDRYSAYLLRNSDLNPKYWFTLASITTTATVRDISGVWDVYLKMRRYYASTEYTMLAGTLLLNLYSGSSTSSTDAPLQKLRFITDCNCPLEFVIRRTGTLNTGSVKVEIMAGNLGTLATSGSSTSSVGLFLVERARSHYANNVTWTYSNISTGDTGGEPSKPTAYTPAAPSAEDPVVVVYSTNDSSRHRTYLYDTDVQQSYVGTGTNSDKPISGAGVASALASNIPIATSSAIGGIKIGYSESGSNYAVKLDSQKAYVTVPWTDTKQTVASSTNQMYLTGVANVDGTAQTGMANTKIYATDGQLRATKFDVNGGCTLQYNSTTNALDFVFPS